MEGVVLLLVAVTFLLALVALVYASYESYSFVNSQTSIAATSYGYMQEILNISSVSNYTCTSTIPAFSVFSTGIVAIKSPYSYKKAISYNGGIPDKNTIYYGSSEFFILSDYPIPAGNYTDLKICLIPSTTNPVFTISN